MESDNIQTPPLTQEVYPPVNKSKGMSNFIGHLLTVIISVFITLLIVSFRSQSPPESGEKDTQTEETVQKEDEDPKESNDRVFLKEAIKGECLRYSYKGSPKNVFETYTIIEDNETVYTIANSQLGKADRAGEIINLNKQKYPALEDNGFFNFKPGFSLLMPPKEVELESDDIRVSSGLVKEIKKEGSQWLITDSKGSIVNYYPKKTTLIEEGANETGACVDIVHDFATPHNMYMIVSQVK